LDICRFNSLVLLCPLHEGCPLPSDRLNAGGKLAFNNFWEQIGLPEECPRAEDKYHDSHFGLPKAFRDCRSDEPAAFKYIHKLCYDLLPEREKSTPYHKTDLEDDDQAGCECVYMCDDRCINRLLTVECDDKICNVLRNREAAIAKGEDVDTEDWATNNCGNRNFTQRKYAATDRIAEENMGFGLKATEFIPEGKYDHDNYLGCHII
jgi:hypothetical protein